MIATKIVGAILGVGLVFGGYAAIELGPIAPLHVECTDAQVRPLPDSNGMQIELTCHAGEAEVVLTIPDVPEF